MVLLLHLAKFGDRNKSKESNEYKPESLVTDGFIHCSLLNQIIEVANKFYFNQQDLVLFCIDSKKVKAEIKYEDLNK